MDICTFLQSSYTAFHAAENVATMVREGGFTPLSEGEVWKLREGGRYYVRRGGAVIAFRFRGAPFRIVASHTDSPALKLKENPLLSDENFTRLNTEPYGGGLWYSFFDRPLRIAGRIIREREGVLQAENYVSPFRIVLPSLAIHQNREANDRFAPNLQAELPLLSLGKKVFSDIVGDAAAYDLFAVPDEAPFAAGSEGELLCAPRIDNLSSVYYSVKALLEEEGTAGTPIAACLAAEEIGSRTYDGAGSDFLRCVLTRLAGGEEARQVACAKSFAVSLDNAHSLHPNHPETCDPTNRPVLGKGIVIKGHAGGAYTTTGLTAAVIRAVFARANVPVQSFCNRSDARSGSTLGAISLTQAGIPSVDIGLAQLAMHSAAETAAMSDFDALERGLRAFFGSNITIGEDGASVLLE